jgi:hypothetical protein
MLMGSLTAQNASATSSCPDARIDYGRTPANWRDDGETLSLWQRPATCQPFEPPADAIVRGPYRLDKSCSDRSCRLWLTSDGVSIQVVAAIPLDQVMAALASIGPLDLASQPVERLVPPPK